jgi:type IX secretion system PorP/SprF family membrane protein
MKRIGLFISALLCGFYALAQQDPQYALYQFNQMVINPAYAGARDGLAAVASTRKQWAGFAGAPQTTCFSLHTPIVRKNIGVGLTAVNDIMGPRNVVSIYGNFAYILKINNKLKLSFGVNGGYNKYQFNFSEVNFKSVDVPAQAFQNQNLGTLDINSGLYLRSNSFFVGVSATHINTPKAYTYQSDSTHGKFVYKLSTHMFITAGRSFIINKDFIFAPTILVKIVNSNYSPDFNLNFFIYKKLWLGVFFRNTYGPGGLIQYYLTDKLRVAYSYDSGINDARRLGGSHEVMIGFDLRKESPKAKMISPRFL